MLRLPPTAARRPFAPLLLVALSLSACGGKKQPPPKQPPVVGVVTAQPTTVPVDLELPGRTSPFLTSDVRPQVSGILLSRLFTEGTRVAEGQPLYRIDPRTYQAAVGQAQGNLASAQANAVAARLKAQRYSDLEKLRAVARQDADDARATAGQANASIQQNQAALRSAQINLGYTVIRAPISGVIGRSLVTPGALVTADQTTVLATIQRLDPIYVDIQQSSAQLLQLRQALMKGGALPATAPVRLKLEDGESYASEGTLLFNEVTVDTSTGAVALRARFPNPKRLLFPGMFVRAVVTQARRPGVFALPAIAVQQQPSGESTVLVVGPGNKVAQRAVKTMGLQDQKWIVTDGIRAGDRVVVEGSGNAKPGQQVRPVAATGSNAESAVIAPGAGDGGGGDGKSAKKQGQ